MEANIFKSTIYKLCGICVQDMINIVTDEQEVVLMQFMEIQENLMQYTPCHVRW